jgi:hypothetical protein
VKTTENSSRPSGSTVEMGLAGIRTPSGAIAGR